jgi:Zn-dependent membrane protease YugP
MYFDPMYLMIIAPGLLLSLWASWRVKSNFKKYSKVRSGRNITGADAAAELLQSAGINDVRIVRTQGMLSDHYNPVNKKLALSPTVHDSPSVAAVGIAAHEAGHAIQHIGYLMMIFGLMMSWAGLMYIGMILFSAVLLFQIVTLPVEFNASSRAKALLVNRGIITERERVGVDKVLNAAAMTYVAAVVSTLLTLLYFLLRSGLLGGRR